MEIIKQIEFGLTPDVLQELMTAGPGAVISHQVGRGLLHKTPLFDRTGRAELRHHMSELVDELRERLAAEGLGPDVMPVPPGTTIPKRLRDEASYLAALLTYMPGILDDADERLALLEEGIYWARVANDGLQEALLRQICAWRHMDTGELNEAIRDYRKGIEAAAPGRHTPIELELRCRMIELMLHTGDINHSEEEATALLALVTERFEGETERYYRSRPLRYFGRIALERGEFAEAIRLLEDAGSRTDEETDPVHHVAILFSLASAYQGIGESAEAIELLVKVGEISKRINRTALSARAYAQTGEIYLESGDPERAEEAFELAERLVANANLPILQRTIQLQKLPLYQRNGRTEEGIELCRELPEHFTRKLDRIKIFRILGLLLEQKGDVGEAEAVLRNAWREIPEGTLRLGIPLAGILVARGKDSEARDLLLPLCSTPPEEQSLMESYADGLELLSEIARSNSDYDTALDRLKQAGEIRLAAERSRSEQSIRNARVLADRRVSDEKSELVRTRRERSEEKLAELLTGLKVNHDTLLRIEDRLRANLAWMEPEQIEQVVEGLNDAITDPETERAVRQVVSEAEAVAELHGVEEAFFGKLREHWPNLTKKQQQLCGLIRAGLKTDQIAHLTGVTENAVLTQRKRLRKRMGLEPGENLNRVVMRVGGDSGG